MRAEQRDFLVELGTEELPPHALLELSQAFASGLTAGLADAGLRHAAIKPFATPRRLAVWVKRLAARQPEQNLKRRGPAVSAAFDAAGAPTRAALAFAQSCGTSVEMLQRLEEAKGVFLFFIGTKPGAEAVTLLPGIVQKALEGLPIPKRMRWGAGTAEFVRPVHWLVLLYGKEVIPATLLDTRSGQTTQGHRFLAPRPLRVATPGSYARLLGTRGFVVADFAARRERIRQHATAQADELGGRALFDAELLDEVTALVEWPVSLAGRFDARFLELPREVLISTLQDHQRYFPVEDAHGVLMPWFITTSNIESREPAKVREGNERVVRSRLADAAFFWEQDRKQPLAARSAGLDSITFQAQLGSLGDKTRRVRALVGEIAAAMQADRAAAERAAELCKCDLATAMVGEFPELQGIMGRYYALLDGEPQTAADAIREHYLPRGAGDALPTSAAGTALALADKLDTLTGIFAIGQKPSGTRDPFGLRRAAIGVLRMLIEQRVDLDLRSLIERAVALQPVTAARTADEAYDYILERLRAYYLEGAGRAAATSAISTEMFDAVLATQPRSPLDFDARLQALAAFLALPEAASLTAANKRIANILKKADGAPRGAVDVAVLRAPAEVRLFDAMRALAGAVSNTAAQREYTASLGLLAQLRSAVDTFFDEVMVMDPDETLRANRLALLAELRGLFAGVADLSRLPG
ncbi:MAG TPA: glycine--tRNA ligase subunit beta [Steroidobacteraceae bacterium]|jgi:glycyl-tRNA synthetase beta chain|nr:glycine--tRNA ligase subunit beta [Steroidobacteraceae bacterium]